MPPVVLRAMLESDWFMGLKKSQRAMYAVKWFHWLKRGSNQYKRILATNSPRFRAEEAQRLARAAKVRQALEVSNAA